MKSILKPLLAIVFIGLLPVLGVAQTAAEGAEMAAEPAEALPVLDQWRADRTLIFPAEGLDLSQFVWQARPLVVFADSREDTNFSREMMLLTQRIDELAERDVIVITDTDPANPSAIRTMMRPRGFMLALVDKDGRVVLRKPSPWDVRELTRWIDKSTSRQEEVRERRESEAEALQ